jgi:S1-C subfamily serine protease
MLISSGGSVADIEQVNREIESLRAEINSLPQAYKEAIDEKIDEYQEETDYSSYTVSVVDGTEFTVDEVYLSGAYDLAAFQLPAGDCPYVKLSANSDLAQGTRLYTIGNPSGLGYTVTSGVFSGYRQSDEGEYIQTDAPINPGNSGGPLVTPLGLLVGINTMILTGTEGIGFAIPAGTVEADFADIIPFEKAEI